MVDDTSDDHHTLLQNNSANATHSAGGSSAHDSAPLRSASASASASAASGSDAHDRDRKDDVNLADMKSAISLTAPPARAEAAIDVAHATQP
jgi:hypothetical protein